MAGVGGGSKTGGLLSPVWWPRTAPHTERPRSGSKSPRWDLAKIARRPRPPPPHPACRCAPTSPSPSPSPPCTPPRPPLRTAPSTTEWPDPTSSVVTWDHIDPRARSRTSLRASSGSLRRTTTPPRPHRALTPPGRLSTPVRPVALATPPSVAALRRRVATDRVRVIRANPPPRPTGLGSDRR